MYVTIVDVLVKKEHVSDFIQATEDNHLSSVTEQGNCRFDVLQSDLNPQQFILYEAYLSEEQAREHKKTSHYLNWRETVADWMEAPRTGVTYTGLYPKF
ncbi:hypothetical protein MNBD_GAMMA09-2446 [hydrothermal vent metagenome]|uniref:ABM domain-containing protein n=1 Tax=hydrothermal vent metagenome TaxID=652676 RepID=A0A3B0XT54_9ZZZZ